jgi:hypothetical protein
MAIGTKIVKSLGYVWSTPTVLGALVVFYLPMWVFGQLKPFRWKDGAWEWLITQDSWLYNHYTKRGWVATTLGYVIFWSPSDMGGTYYDYLKFYTHERRHVWQSLVLGPFYLPVYLVLSCFYGYHNNPMEIDARSHEIF